jgi:hypothetical protein
LPKLWLPEVALVPLQPPLAEQLDAFVLDHETDVLPLYAGAIGFAESVTVGAGGGGAALTVTAADAVALPPLPVHVRLYVALALSGPTDSVPLVLREPLHPPDAAQDDAFVLDQVSDALAPESICVGLAVSDTAGAAAGASTETVVLRDTLPPRPTHCRV